ncbi:uncharacterized protein LOC143191466 [Rhynchophorus ferrugineus]|uniref:uncharacterized protein LOC143191466 n=1 Tax=Rhynchophorus ferrugineus TaxID=354439 RepID=UPI003FCE1C73
MDTIWRIIILSISLILFPSVYGEKCSHTVNDENVTILCQNATVDDYLDNIFEMKINIRDFLDDNTTNISIRLNNCNFSHVDEWIYTPWEEYMKQVVELRITNSSVNHIRSLSKFKQLRILDLSSNNLSDYTFLSRMTSITHLHLGHSNFSPDSFLFAYIMRETTKLSILDLSYSNLTNFTIPINVRGAIKGYDLSHSDNLTEIVFESSLGDVRPYLNFDGNRNLRKIQHTYNENYFICVSSLDWSNSHVNFTDTLKNIRLSDKIILKDNYLPVLNETTLNLTRLRFHWCLNDLGLSIDLSNTSLANISDGFFNEQLLNELNLSFNNLSTLEYPLFLESQLVYLNLSSSNISSLSPNVFSNLTVETIDLSNNNLRWLDGIFSRAHTIKKIILSSNPIATITKSAFKKCRDLESLDLTNTYALYSGNVFATLPSLRNFNASFSKSLYTSEILNMNLSNLTIVNSKLDKLNSSSFKGFYKLKKLTFVNSSTSGMSEDVFKGLYSLRNIDIRGLSDLSVDLKIFKPLTYLEVLDLSNYKLKKLQTNLKTLQSLKTLNLSSNALSLEKDSFSGLTKLEILCLTDNKLSSLPAGLFAPLEKLTHLYLNKNDLQQLASGTFSNLNNLEVLDLSNNGLYRTKLHILVSVSMIKMQYLYLQNNNLGSEYAHEDSNIRKNEFKLISTHPSLKQIDINNNEWQCNTLIDLVVIFRDRNISFVPAKPSYKETNINGISCS